MVLECLSVNNKRLFKGLGILALFSIGAILALYCYVLTMVSMPGHTWSGALPPLSAEQKVVEAHLRRNLTFLAQEIGERNFLRPGTLERSADYIAAQFQEIAADPSTVQRQHFQWGGGDYQNVILELKGATKPGEIVIVGAHYDTVSGCAGADDNGSGVVGVARQTSLLLLGIRKIAIL